MSASLSKYAASAVVAALSLTLPAFGAEPSFKIIAITSKDNTIMASYPILTGLNNHAVEDKLNQAIIAETHEWNCDGAPEPGKTQFHVSPEVTELTQTVFSYKLNFEYYCGGAYPDSHVEGRNFNLTNGEPLTLEELLPAIDGKAITEALLEDAKMGEECTDNYNENVTYEFYISHEGVVIFPQFPHVIQACREEHTFPLTPKIR